jgi:hypothetical protein
VAVGKRSDHTFDVTLLNVCQNVFLDFEYEVKKYLEDVSAGIGIYIQVFLQLEVKFSEVNFDLTCSN